MKKFLKILGFFVLVTATTQCLAGDEIDAKLAKKEKKELTKEQKRLEKERKQEEKLRKKEMKVLEKENKKKQAEEKRKARKQKQEQRKFEDKMKAEEAKLHKDFEKERTNKTKKYERAQREEARKIKQIEKENRARAKKEQRQLAKMKREEEKHLACLTEKNKEHEKQLKKDEVKFKNRSLAANWKNLRKAEVETEYKDGKYADVHMLPAWPFSNWFFKEKAMLNVNATYWYATDSYDSDGASRDLTALAFGEQKIHLKDILLASKLLGSHQVELINANSQLFGMDNFIRYFGNNIINFNGKTEKYGLEFDFARHVLRDDITIGIQVPVLYVRNRLDENMEFSASNIHGNDPYIEDTTLVYQEALRRVLKSKGINELGGSACGLGDITLFGNVEVTTRYIDKIVVGLKVGLPTGKEESMSKLWSPALSSNDKCAEFAAFVSMLVNYNRYVNPHLSLQASFFSTSHIDKRVPHMIESPANAQDGEEVGNDLMAMGDRIKYTDPVTSFQDYDSAIRCFADKPVSMKYEKGPEFHVRLGNVFDKFICRRGFLDIYYDLRFKLEDNYRSGNKEGYNTELMEDNTRSVEHRFGMEFSHQYDSRTRLKAVLNYSFAGTNAPKVFDVGMSLGHSF